MFVSFLAASHILPLCNWSVSDAIVSPCMFNFEKSPLCMIQSLFPIHHLPLHLPHHCHILQICNMQSNLQSVQDDALSLTYSTFIYHWIAMHRSALLGPHCHHTHHSTSRHPLLPGIPWWVQLWPISTRWWWGWHRGWSFHHLHQHNWCCPLAFQHAVHRLCSCCILGFFGQSFQPQAPQVPHRRLNSPDE